MISKISFDCHSNIAKQETTQDIQYITNKPKIKEVSRSFSQVCNCKILQPYSILISSKQEELAQALLYFRIWDLQTFLHRQLQKPLLSVAFHLVVLETDFSLPQAYRIFSSKYLSQTFLPDFSQLSVNNSKRFSTPTNSNTYYSLVISVG